MSLVTGSFEGIVLMSSLSHPDTLLDLGGQSMYNVEGIFSLDMQCQHRSCYGC